MSILKNAIDSIAIGLEDFESTDERRIISSTRNIFAGILLLFKHKLCELSPEDSDEVLIKQKVLPRLDPTGAIGWIGQGKKTVDVQNIKERFNSLNISVEWPRLEKINNYRNDIEHYYSTKNKESVQELISNSFLIIRDFIVDELEEDPISLLGEKYWKILVDVNEVYAREEQQCYSSLEELTFFTDTILEAIKAYSCPNCGSGLIGTQDSGYATSATFNCRACGTDFYYTDIIHDAINKFYPYDSYLAIKDGDRERPIISCPFCFDGDYIMDERICTSCGETAYHECTNCGCNIPSEEISDDDSCSYCSYMHEKFMKE